MIQKINHLASVVMVKLNTLSMKDYASLKQASNIIHIFQSLQHFKSFVVLLQTNLLIRKKLVQINHICKHNPTVSKYNMIMTW
jgi:hypothetical protein